MAESDAADVAKARAGDNEAFRALVERHSRNLFRLAFRLTGNREDADEVVQDAFLKAYRELPRFESRASFGTWLHRIGVNCALDLLRTRMRRNGHETWDALAEDERLGDTSVQIPRPDRLLYDMELRQEVDIAIAQLTALERAAFTLRHFEGHTIEEIGQMLGLKTSATKHSIFRAVRKLRRSLAPVLGRPVPRQAGL